MIKLLKNWLKSLVLNINLVKKSENKIYRNKKF